MAWRVLLAPPSTSMYCNIHTIVPKTFNGREIASKQAVERKKEKKREEKEKERNRFNSS